LLDSLQEFLDPHPIVGQVRGQGMWLAVDFTDDKETRTPFEDDTVRAVVSRMYEHGVIASPIGTAFELAPPLIATKADLDETVRVAALAIDEVARERRLM
jgi:putrescine---pyruvate transaminase